jgi:hypothetical protein
VYVCVRVCARVCVCVCVCISAIKQSTRTRAHVHTRAQHMRKQASFPDSCFSMNKQRVLESKESVP